MTGNFRINQKIKNKKPAKISIIASIAKDRGIGKENELLWHIPEDLRRFKRITLGHPVIMGRKTFESIGKPLPERFNIVISKKKTYQAPGCYVYHSIKEAIKLARQREKKEIFIIGGGQIYKQTLPFADKLYLTLVDKVSEADTFFPDYSDSFEVISKKRGRSGNLNYTFLELERIR